MTDDELLTIEARAKAATPGPWLIEVEALRPRVDGERVTDFGNVTICSFESNDPPDPNAEFVAHARTDVPDLLREVRWLRGQLNAEIDHRTTAVQSAHRLETELKCYRAVKSFLPLHFDRLIERGDVAACEEAAHHRRILSSVGLIKEK